MLLKSVQNTSHQFCLLQLDQIQGLAELFEVNLQEKAGLKFMSETYEQLMTVLSSCVSGVIVSPEYNFSSILKKDHQAGLLLGLERRLDAIDPLNLPPLVQDWGVEHIRNNYALAKLELYYHPQEPEAIRKKQLVAEIYEYCRMLDIDFLLELKLFSPQESLSSKSDMQEAQIMAIEDFRNQCSLIALEFPGDTLSAVTITAELDIPWIMTSSAVGGYERFKENLRIALESGAKGFMAGNLIWQDIFGKINPEQWQKWQQDFAQLLSTKVRDRVVELSRIASEAGKK